VLAGGRSSEHEVSLASAEGVTAALDPARYEVLPVRISREGRWTLDGREVVLAPGGEAGARLVSLDGAGERPVDVVFPVLHGPFGEDGTVQGLCEMAGVAYVGAGVAASAAGMDKAMFKALMRDAGLPVPRARVVEDVEWRRDPDAVREAVARQPGYPAFCKPCRLGSSVGISPVPGPADLDAALQLALRHDSRALVEERIVGREVEVGVLGNREAQASPAGEVAYDSEWYDYETKYLPDRMRLRVPADLPPAVADRVRALALRAFAAVGCLGMARVDFFVRGDEVLISELNTIPGFTPTSVYARLFAAGGVQYGDLVDRLVALAVEARDERSRYAC
jgi:D-alanine-D-alanine ligase